MSRVRPNQRNRQTAAAYENEQEGSGCFSFYMLPPFMILFIGVIIAIIEFNIPFQISSSSSSKSLASLFTPEVQYWGSAIDRWSSNSNLDPNLVATVMQIESCGNPFARSSAGAMGLFQVMPYHFDIIDNSFDPDTNALRGLTYLRYVFGIANRNIAWTLAAYNGGPSLIGLNQSMWPAETIRYVYWGNGIYIDAAQMRSTSQRLNEWLTAGGTSLCQKAHRQLNLP